MYRHSSTMTEEISSYIYNKDSTGFVWQSFGSGGATRMAYVTSWLKLPHFPTESMPASSEMDPPLAKVELISDGSNANIW